MKLPNWGCVLWPSAPYNRITTIITKKFPAKRSNHAFFTYVKIPPVTMQIRHFEKRKSSFCTHCFYVKRVDTEKLRPTVTKSAVLLGNKNKNMNQKSGVGKRELRTTEYARGAAFLSFFFFFFEILYR